MPTLTFLLVLSAFRGNGHAAEARTLTLLPAGTPVEDIREDAYWNRVVLLARPTIATGDVNALSASVKTAASSFVLSIVASIGQSAGEDGRALYRLVDVGVGYSTPVKQRLTIVTPEGAARAGAQLGLYQRGMLGESMKQITSIPVLAKTDRLVLFETKGLMHRDGKHLNFKVRHFVWINSSSGLMTMLVWLVEDQATGGAHAVVDEPMRWVPSGMKESREIHVDGNEFSLLGIPGEKAFALEDLPPGKEIPWTSAAKAIAGRVSYSEAQLMELTKALSDAIAAARASQDDGSP